jgi:hypothetical protein
MRRTLRALVEITIETTEDGTTDHDLAEALMELDLADLVHDEVVIIQTTAWNYAKDIKP